MTNDEAMQTILNSSKVVETIGGINQTYLYTGSMELVITWTRNDTGEPEVIHVSA